MTESLPPIHDARQSSPHRAWFLFRWVAMTALVAWLAPYAVAALVAALCGLLGATTADVRSNVVSLATLQSDGWSSVGIAWQVFAWCTGGTVVLWRAWHSQFVGDKRALLANRIEVVAERAYGAFVERLERVPRATQVGFFVAGVVMVVLCLAALPGGERPQRVSMPLTLAKPPTFQPSAALALPGGFIRSGDATVQQRDRDTYVVTFAAPAAN